MVVERSPPVFFSAIETSTKSGDGMGVILDPRSLPKRFVAWASRVQPSRPPLASDPRHEREPSEKGTKVAVFYPLLLTR